MSDWLAKVLNFENAVKTHLDMCLQDKNKENNKIFLLNFEVMFGRSLKI